MILDRRTFIGGSAALALSGCATTGSRGLREPCTPLTPVRIDPSLLLRTVAGLRPYRASGFVVRAEPLGGKKLVHNYGHGGAGITLSWGSSRLATNVGLAGHSGPVAVIGAGAMGLTTARLVQEAGFPVTIYTAALPPQTTSAVAGGQISPFGHFREDSVTPEWTEQFHQAMRYSWERFQLMVGTRYGIRWLPTYEQVDPGPLEPSPLDAFHPGIRKLAPGEHPFAAENVARFSTMYVETPRFLQELTADLLRAGGKMKLRSFSTPADIAALDESLVFNCTGLGARQLFGDEGMIPVRGQLAVLRPQPEVRYAYSMRGGYMFPRSDGVLLGGTFERNAWEAVPQPDDIARIMQRHRDLFAGFRCAA
ncbi:MAG TPA: FAD-dependent oxidoreductase [Sphingomicrobium sp.]